MPTAPTKQTAATVAEPTRPARRRPGRPQGGRAIADRSQLLAAAELVISTNGPDATMEAIASGAGVTKPILYRGVGDRDALVAALAELLVDRINTASSVAYRRARTPRARMRSLVAAYIEVVESNRNLYLFVTAGGSNVDRVGQAMHLADRSAVPISAELAKQRAATKQSPAVALTWSYGLIGTLQFVTLWWLRDATITADQLVDHVTELLWSGVGGTSSPRPASRKAVT
ncbi:MAG: TetR/AcrR family transcriptional regulator [Ilumatobacteraceae bacterium]